MATSRRQFIQKDTFQLSAKCFNKTSHSPTSTDASQSPRDLTDTPTKHSHDHSYNCRHENKQKSQLCKKFVQNGFCPYKKRCKFAHGSHELRKNSQVNSKYKTKQCGVYVIEGSCMYGDRCNFIHKAKFQFEEIDFEEKIDLGFLEVKSGVRSGSRLLSLLQ